MIEQQLGFSLESFLRGIVGISTVLGVAYLMSYDRKRVDWKLVGGGLFMQFVFALAVLYVPVGRFFVRSQKRPNCRGEHCSPAIHCRLPKPFARYSFSQKIP